MIDTKARPHHGATHREVWQGGQVLGGQAVKEITHQILLASRDETEHKLVMTECERAVSLGGSFKIENRYTDNWYSFITIYYPETKP